jgi:hypothetical protein
VPGAAIAASVEKNSLVNQIAICCCDCYCYVEVSQLDLCCVKLTESQQLIGPGTGMGGGPAAGARPCSRATALDALVYSKKRSQLAVRDDDSSAGGRQYIIVGDEVSDLSLQGQVLISKRLSRQDPSRLTVSKPDVHSSQGN